MPAAAVASEASNLQHQQPHMQLIKVNDRGIPCANNEPVNT